MTKMFGNWWSLKPSGIVIRPMQINTAADWQFCFPYILFSANLACHQVNCITCFAVVITCYWWNSSSCVFKSASWTHHMTCLASGYIAGATRTSRRGVTNSLYFGLDQYITEWFGPPVCNNRLFLEQSAEFSWACYRRPVFFRDFSDIWKVWVVCQNKWHSFLFVRLFLIVKQGFIYTLILKTPVKK